LLSPDLIIGNKEENTKADIEALEKIAPVWISDICTIEDSLDMIQCIGALVNRNQKAAEIIAELRTEFEKIKDRFKGKTVLYVIWQNPIMIAASGTYINAMLEHLGFVNLASEHTRYPELTIAELKKMKADYLFLSSEPFPFKEKDLRYFAQELPQTKVKLVDGELYSWYGSRLIGNFDALI
jgi:ABC-type Fe3+-hydroxamate transport system substrate-binding protein